MMAVMMVAMMVVAPIMMRCGGGGGACGECHSETEQAKSHDDTTSKILHIQLPVKGGLKAAFQMT